jgi:DTW domain-containing protein YfiP
MSKKAAKKSAAAGSGRKGFSTRAITEAINTALEGLRAERKANSTKWSIGQHLQAAACETSLLLAKKHCACTSSSLSFPAKVSHHKFLVQLGKEK